MAKGTITRQDVIKEDAVTWGRDYEQNVEAAIAVNGRFTASVLSMATANEKLRRSENQTEYLNQKNQVKLALDQANAAIKEQQALEISLQKIKQESINTDKKQIELESKKQKAKDQSKKLTIEERVQLEITNRALREQAREILGLVGPYEKLNKARKDAQTRLADLLAEGRRADQTQKQFNATVKQAATEFDKYNEKIKRVDAATDKFVNNIGNYKSAFSAVRNIGADLIAGFGVLTGVNLFVGAVQNIYQTEKQLQSLDLALKAVTETEANLAEQQNFLTRIARENSLEIKNLTGLYTKFYVAAKDKLAGNEIQQIFEDIAKSGSALGLSNESLERSFVALNQMLSKGTVQSEELRGQLAENLPGAVQAMVAATKKLHPELKELDEKGFFKLVKDGKILASEVLPETAKQLLIITGADKVAGIDTLAKSANRLTNEWTDLVRVVGDSEGVFSSVAKFFTNMATDLVQGFKAIAESAMEERARILKQVQEKSYSEAIVAFKEFSKNDLDNVRAYNSNKIKENAEAIVKLTEDNVRFRKVGLNSQVAANKKQIEDFNSHSAKLIGQNQAINKLLADSAPKPKPTADGETEAERNKRLAKLKKELDEYLKLRKKAIDDEFALLNFRNEREIYYNQIIVDNEKKTAEERVEAFLNIEQIKRSAADDELQHELQTINIGKIEQLKAAAELAGTIESFSKAKIDSMISVSDAQIAEIIKTGKLRKDATAEEILAFEEYQLKIQKITQGSEENKQKIIDSEVGKIQTKLDLQLKAQDTELNNALKAEDILFEAQLNGQKASEEAIREHERRKNEIRIDAAKKAISTQIDILQGELDADAKKEKNAQISADKRIDIENKLSKLRLEINSGALDRLVELEEAAAEKIKDLRAQLTSALVDLVNTLFDARIAKIDGEIQASDEYYATEIEKAGDDQRKKDVLQQEAERKRQELEKKKRAEQVKAAIFNKVIALAQIGLDLAKTLVAINLAAAEMDALAAFGFGSVGAAYRGLQIGLAVGIAAVQTTTVLATPLPKYRRGRRKGPAEAAVVGDGGVPEVITDSQGNNPRITGDKPEVTYLNKDDMVFANESEYERYVRTATLQGIKKHNDRIQGFAPGGGDSMTDRELLEEMKRNTRAVERNKPIKQKSEKMDIPHSVWAYKNINWRA